MIQLLPPMTPPRPGRPAAESSHIFSPDSPVLQAQIVSPGSPPLISTPPLPAHSYSSPLKRRSVTLDNSEATSSKIHRISKTNLRPNLSPLQKRYGHAPNPKDKAPPPTPKIANKCKAHHLAVSVEQQQKRARFQEARDAADAIAIKLPLIGTGRFHNTYAVGDDAVLKTPNEIEFRDSEGKGLIFERIEFAQANYHTLLQAQANGLLPDLHIAQTKFDSEHAIIRQARCPHLLTIKDLTRPEVVTKLANLFHSAFEHNIPLDLKTDNLGWMDEARTQLVLFDFLEAKVGSFRVRTQSLLEECAQGDPELFQALDPRPPGSLH